MKKISPDDISYLSLTPATASKLGECIQRVYGESYPLPEYYNGDYVAGLLADKLLYSEVALSPQGEAIGTNSTQLEQIGDLTADGTMTMVDENFRGLRILTSLGTRMTSVYQQLGIAYLQLYALALHHIVQEQSAAAGAAVTGILPTYFSHRATMSGFNSNEDRVGAVVMHLPLGQLPQRQIYLPAIYREPVENVYLKLGLRREVSNASGNLPDSPCTAVRDAKPSNQLLRLRFDLLGRDFSTLVSQALSEPGFDIFYLDLPLADPAIHQAVEIAREIGFFYGSLILERCGSDRIRMQYYDQALYQPDNLKIASDEGKALRDFVLKDAS